MLQHFHLQVLCSSSNGFLWEQPYYPCVIFKLCKGNFLLYKDIKTVPVRILHLLYSSQPSQHKNRTCRPLNVTACTLNHSPVPWPPSVCLGVTGLNPVVTALEGCTTVQCYFIITITCVCS